MLRRLIIIVLSAFLSVAVLAAVLVIFLLRTPPGQRAVLQAVLPRIAAETGIGIEIGGVGGAWPAQLSLRDVRLSDADGVWFEAKRITVLWQPWAALSNRYLIDAAVIRDGHFLREPNIPGNGEPRRPGPRRYPLVRIDAISAPNFRMDEPVIDQALSFDLKGSLELAADGAVTSAAEFDLSTAEIVNGTLARILGPRVQLKGRIAGTAGRSYAFENVSLGNATKTVAISGRGGYEVASRNIRADLGAVLAAQVAQEIDPKLNAKSATQVALKAQGPWRNLALMLTSDVSALTYAGKDIPASHIDGNLVHSRRALEGPVRIAFKEKQPVTGPEEVAGTFSWNRKTAISVSGLEANYRGAQAAGGLAFDIKAGSVRADLTLDIQNLGALPLGADIRGAVRGRAKLDLGGASESVDLDLRSPVLAVEGFIFEDVVATAKGALDNAKAQVIVASVMREGLGQATDLRTTATIDRSGTGTRIGFDMLRMAFGKQGASLAAPAVLNIGDEIVLGPTNVRWGEKGRIALQGRYGKEIVAELSVRDLDVPQYPVTATGTVSIDTGKAETGRISLHLVPTDRAGGPELRSDIDGRWENGRLALTGAIEGYGADAAFARIQPVAFSMPLELARKNGSITGLSTTGPIQGRVLYRGPIDRFMLLVPLARQTLEGAADIDIAVSGTLSAPRFTGRASLSNGKYENVANGVFLDRLNVRGEVVRAGEDYVLSLQGAASDGADPNGSLELQGQVLLGARPRVDASLRLNRARVIRTRDLTAITSGNVRLTGTMPNLMAQGALDVQSFQFQIPEALPPDIVDVKVVRVDAQGNPIVPESPKKRESPLVVALNVAIAAREQVFFRGRGLDSEWSAQVRALGTVDDPKLEGELTLRRGRFDFSGRPFTLTEGGRVHFVASRGLDPDLSVEARNRTLGGTTAIITVTGRASHPDIKMTSEPPLPQDDVMALVLFGRPAAELSALQAVQVANAIATLTGDNPFARGPGILDRARTSLGLDLLDVSFGGPSGGAVTLGKYLTRGLFVSASPGVGTSPGSVSVRIDVSRSITLETSVGQDSQESVGIKWKHDY